MQNHIIKLHHQWWKWMEMATLLKLQDKHLVEGVELVEVKPAIAP